MHYLSAINTRNEIYSIQFDFILKVFARIILLNRMLSLKMFFSSKIVTLFLEKYSLSRVDPDMCVY